MKTVIVALLSVLFLFAPIVVRAESDGIEKIEASIDVLKEIMAVPEKDIPPTLLSNATGVAIIPHVVKAGLIIGGRYGTGVLLVHDKDGRWSNPSFITITGGSIGWQIGVEAMDIVMVFKNEKSINLMLSGKFTLGVDASVAAGPVGREVSAATDIQLKSEIYSFSRTKGLFAGLSLGGSVIQIDDETNERVYGERGILARDIFSNKQLKAPAPAETLKKMLTEYTSMK